VAPEADARNGLGRFRFLIVAGQADSRGFSSFRFLIVSRRNDLAWFAISNFLIIGAARRGTHEARDCQEPNRERCDGRERVGARRSGMAALEVMSAPGRLRCAVARSRPS
jgi:hypothetical protein